MLIAGAAQRRLGADVALRGAQGCGLLGRRRIRMDDRLIPGSSWKGAPALRIVYFADSDSRLSGLLNGSGSGKINLKKQLR